MRPAAARFTAASFAAGLVAAGLVLGGAPGVAWGQVAGQGAGIALGADLGVTAGAAQAAALSVRGRVAHEMDLTVAQLRARPAVSVEVEQQTSKGMERFRFTGAALWPLLTEAGLQDEAGPRSALQHTIMARGRDGYAVALAIGELNPEFAGKPVLIAYEMDGATLPVLRLVVPGDRRAGRSVRDVVGIEVR